MQLGRITTSAAAGTVVCVLALTGCTSVGPSLDADTPAPSSASPAASSAPASSGLDSSGLDSSALDSSVPAPDETSLSTPVLIAPPDNTESPPPTPTPTPTPGPDLTPTPTTTPAPDSTDLAAVVETIPDGQWDRMVRTGVWRTGCPVGRDDLRRVTLTYVNFAGGIERGTLVVNQDVVDDLIAVFADLLDAGFPIERMRPVEQYGGNVNTSLAANNTSAFNCRRPDQTNAPIAQSPHANGRAIDINPVQNPWRDPRCSCWSPTDEFADATDGPGVIREGSLPVELFEARGWIWQDIKVADYMHFDTGYPSRPWHSG